MHEFGHVLGLPDVDGEDELLGSLLRSGVQHRPTPADVDRVHALTGWLAPVGD